MNIRIEAGREEGDEGGESHCGPMGLIDEKEKFDPFPCRAIFERARASTSFYIFEECISSFFSIVPRFIGKLCKF